MIPQAQALHQLQTIDLQIIQNRKRLKEIATELEDNQDLAEIQGQIQSASEALKPLRTKVRNIELEIQTNNSKKQATEDRLYSGNVKNPKELQDMQQEMASIDKRNEALEEKLLEEMMEVEEAEDVLFGHQTDLETLTAELGEHHTALLQEQKDLAVHIQSLKQSREQALRNVSAESLEKYNSMRKKKGNRPIALMHGNTCNACGVSMTRMTEQAVRKGDQLIPCESCGRILADAGLSEE